MASSMQRLLVVLRFGASVLLLVTPGLAQSDPAPDSKCFGDLGCFSAMAGIPVPADLEEIGTEFWLFTRENQDDHMVMNATDHELEWLSSLALSHFSAQRHTKFIVPGYNTKADTLWINDTKDALLTKDDFNVFVINWYKGASVRLDTVTANTFVVSAQLTRFLHLLQRAGVALSEVHLIGHSFGAHIIGNAAAKIGGVARITGLDPAEPFFVDFDSSRRLDKTDATFVDVIHTDGETFQLTKGYGLLVPMGDVDFYPSGGVDQVGCTDDVLSGLMGFLAGGDGIQCSHSRAHQYFIESINSQCKFRARPCADWATFERGECRDCPSGGCPAMGYDADQTSGRGDFYLAVVPNKPFCGDQYHVRIEFGDIGVDTEGRLDITLLGQNHDSGSDEFSREVESFHANQTADHVIAVNQLAGAISGVKLTYTKNIGHDNHVYINSITVEPFNARNRLVFCGDNTEVVTGQPAVFTTHTGC